MRTSPSIPIQTMTGEPIGEVGPWSPRLDFAEREDGFILTSELPGVDPAAFYREIALPASADPDNLEADFNHGVLTVKVGKRAEARGRRIPVRSQEKPPGQH